MKGAPELPNEGDEIAGRLKRARLDLNLTQATLAKAAGLSRSSIVHYEKGNAIPGGLELIKLARALHRAPNYLLSGTDEFFDSEDPEHARESGQHAVTIQRAVLCLMALDGDVRERASALLMALVREKKGKEGFADFLQAIETVQESVANVSPQIDAMAKRQAHKIQRSKPKP
jgi:transcriptional regulator with XRE-family HTH domain